MAGKGYPSNARAASPFKAVPDFPRLPKVTPTKPFLQLVVDNSRKVPFPQPQRWPIKPFGRRPVVPYMQRFPIRLPRFLPWAAIPLTILPWLLTGQRIQMPSGWRKCYDLGGNKDMRSGPVATGCPSLVGTGNQVPSGWTTDPWVMGASNQDRSVYFGPCTNPATCSRMQYREQWFKPGQSGWPGVTLPNGAPKIWPSFFPDWYLDPDPNWWLPLAPTPYVVPSPTPYINPFPNGDPGPDTYPRSVRSYDPNPVSEIDDSGKPKTDTKDKHRRRRPRKRWEYESKYKPTGKFGLLAGALLGAASNTHGGITEVVDFVAAVYSSLPSQLIARDLNGLAKADVLPHMLGMIWAHRAKIDPVNAIHNLAANAVEDYVWGKYFKAMDQISKTKMGPYMVGFEREYGQLNNEFLDIAREMGIEVPTDPVWWLK